MPDDTDLRSPDPQGTEDISVVRSEERLQVGTERVEAGRVRVRTHVVTETVTRTVPVTHEQLRVDREPVGDTGGRSEAPVALSEQEHEIVLVAEQPVVQKAVVPVERIRLDTVTVDAEQTVTEQVRKEQIEVEEPGRDRA